jgi:NAD(P)-dependent dehydrogenase (short-subunit alcohol dehydrogenase family)
MGSLDGKVVVVTGGATGIGLASARMLAADGATVVIASRDAARGKSVVQSIRESGGQAVSIPTDVADDSQVAELAKRAAEEHGVIDVWFSNAGLSTGFGPFQTFNDAAVSEMLATNVKGVYSGMRHASEHMRAGGVIINNASFVGVVKPSPNALAYGASKAAVISLTRGAAVALEEQTIDVIAIAAYIANTPMSEKMSHPAPVAALAERHNPSGKLIPVEHLAQVVVGFANRTSTFRTGDVFAVDYGPTVTAVP